MSNIYYVNKKKLICPTCGKDHFWTKESLMNTRGATFMNYDWANQGITNFICENCDHIIPFYSTDHIHTKEEIENPKDEKIIVDKPMTSMNPIILYIVISVLIFLAVICFASSGGFSARF